jgi:hypothetical protein
MTGTLFDATTALKETNERQCKVPSFAGVIFT